MVEQQVVSGIEITNLLQQVALHEHARLADDLEGHQIFQLARSKFHYIDQLTAAVDRIDVAEYHPCLRVRLKGCHCPGNGSRSIQVIRVEPADNLRFGASETLV